MSNLKYKFIALYSDGSIFEQNDEDKSLKDAKRSAFFDIDQEKLIAFALKNDNPDKYEEYAVDLRTGEFLLNGISLNNIIFNKDEQEYDFRQNNQDNKLRLIYFRKNSISFSGFRIDGKETTYLLGWQTTDKNGCNIKRIIEIK